MKRVLRAVANWTVRGIRGAARVVAATARALYNERYDLLGLAGAGLLGGGVWTEWGPSWACMLWGVMLLGLAVLHAQRSARREDV